MKFPAFTSLAASLFLVTNLVSAEETIRYKIELPFYSKQIENTYSDSQQAYDEAVEQKKKLMHEQPGGGPAWISEKNQPMKDTTVETEVGASVAGVGIHLSTSTKHVTASSDEAYDEFNDEENDNDEEED